MFSSKVRRIFWAKNLSFSDLDSDSDSIRLGFDSDLILAY